MPEKKDLTPQERAELIDRLKSDENWQAAWRVLWEQERFLRQDCGRLGWKVND